ncbi:interleukin-33 isoform X2 [Sciurus carolinensis]|uniref:interleukin-33 isoform X2 n=1 Tax=Sciurus carolinensis TaxID=30640 RepID=UPI001FB22688|nr:interleukin-33 isoform X2 [Sciurus carolinensis]
MKPKLKYSTPKISSAKLNSTADRTLVKPCKIRKSLTGDQRNLPCVLYEAALWLIIEKKACYFRKKSPNGVHKNTGEKHKEKHQLFAAYQPAMEHSTFKIARTQENTKTFNISSIQESCASLSTYNDQHVSFVWEDGNYVTNVEDLPEDQEKDKVLLRYHVSPYSSSTSDDGVDGKLLMVNLSPTKDRDILLHANNKEQSVELQKCKTPLPDRTFFVLHKESSEFVSFECKSNRGMYIGVKDNHLALVEGKSQTSENIMFKLSLM